MEDTQLKEHSFWKSTSGTVLLNPKLPKDVQESFKKLAHAIPGHLKSHIFLASSGTSGSLKLVALAKSAILHAAQSVNAYLKSDASDAWILPLPHFHIGGLSVYARAHLSQSPVHVYRGDWNALHFAEFCDKNQGTHTSLVPTQIYDLVRAQVKAPASIQCVLVGGAELTEELHTEALRLSWPIFRCYGMTESSAFFACTRLGAPAPYKVLDHMKVRVGPSNEILIKGPSLLSGVMEFNSSGEGHFVDTKTPDGYWNTGDLGEFNTQDGSLLLWGRNKDFIKVLGERVSLDKLRRLLKAELLNKNLDLDFELLALPHPRTGYEITVIFAPFKPKALMPKTDQALCEALLEFNKKVAPFERLQGFRIVPQIPRSELGKALGAELEKLSSKTLTPLLKY